MDSGCQLTAVCLRVCARMRVCWRGINECESAKERRVRQPSLRPLGSGLGTSLCAQLPSSGASGLMREIH